MINLDDPAQLDCPLCTATLLEAVGFKPRVQGRVTAYLHQRGISSLSPKQLMDLFLPAAFTRQGAGGIGGLLARSDETGFPAQHAFYHADANGNVTALVNEKQVVSARYLYDPFGNVVSMSGPLADANLYRFSSKEYHPRAGLVSYLYRDLDPNLQRWTAPDRFGETDGPNLYGFVLNQPLTYVDPDGSSIVGKVVMGVVKLCKGRRAARATSVDGAVRLWKEGEDSVLCPSKDIAKEAARKAGDGSPPIQELDKKTGKPHYHPNDRSGHFLYSLAGALTLSYYAQGYGTFAETDAFILDLVNPLSLPQDIIDIWEMF